MKTSSERLEDVFARPFEDVLKTYGQDKYIGLYQDALKTFPTRLLTTFGKDEYIGLDQDYLKMS